MPAHVREVHDAAGLASIFDDDINMVLWTRGLPVELRSEVTEAFEAFPNHWLTTEDPETDTRRVFAATAKKAGTPVLQAVCEDVIANINVFRMVVGCHKVQVRLERCSEKRKRRMHTDGFRLRALVTYRGTGTRWLANHDTNFIALDTNLPNEDICRHKPQNIRNLEVGDVALWKGNVYPGIKRAFVHGEPIVLAEEDWRWYCVINEVKE